MDQTLDLLLKNRDDQDILRHELGLAGILKGTSKVRESASWWLMPQQ